MEQDHMERVDTEKAALMQMLMEANGREVYLRSRVATAEAEALRLKQEIADLKMKLMAPVDDEPETPVKGRRNNA